MHSEYGDLRELSAGARQERPQWDLPEGQPQDSGGGFSFGAYFGVIRRRKWLILAAGILGSVLAFAVFLYRPPVYVARTTLEVFGVNENFMNFSQVDPQAGIGLYSATASNLLTQIQILRSAGLRERVIERLRLASFPPRSGDKGTVDRMRRALGINAADPDQNSRSALARAVNTFRPGVVRETRILELECQSTNPEVAALYLNTLAEEYIDQSVASRSVSSGLTSEWLNQQLVEAKNRLEASEQKLADFGRRTGYLAPTPADTLSGAKLRQLREELSVAQSERIRKQAELERIANTPKEALVGLVEDTQLRTNQNALLDLRKQLANLLTTYTDAHPAVTKLRAQIAQVQAEVNASQTAVLDRATADYQTAVKRERLLLNAHGTQNRVFGSEYTNAGQRMQLQREVDIALQSYNSLLQQVNQAGMAAVIPSKYVRIIDKARADIEPEGLKIIPTIMLGLMSGILFGAALIVSREAVRGTVHGPQSSARILNAPELGVIPPMGSGGYLEAPVGSAARRLLSAPGLKAKPDSANGNDTALWGGAQHSLYVESFRRAIASLLVPTPKSNGCRVLVVTSIGPSEGKTTVTSSLGIAITEAGKKVLLIDMDLRQPELHARFGAKNGLGAGEVIASGLGLDRGQPLDFIQPTAFPGLDILPAAEVDPAKLSIILYHPNLKSLLTRLRSEYDFILIDTPPVGPFSDARILGVISDGLILVLRAGKATKDAVLEVRRRLSEDNTTLVGTILNDAMPESFAEGYYRYYHRRGSQR